MVPMIALALVWRFDQRSPQSSRLAYPMGERIWPVRIRLGACRIRSGRF